jgi:fluoroacetyl-CoA thioesterase
MKESLQPGLTYEFRYVVPENKTVPYLLPEATELAGMPRVLATGFLVGLIELTCVKALIPHLDWPNEQSVGTDLKITHEAATPPGFTVTIGVKLEKVEGRKLVFSVTASDGADRISHGTHERFVIDSAKFGTRIAAKAAEAKG